ncbi:MAG TPA: PTS sugar transporter subunit IIA [Gemmatimonadales bacterium]|nr:PTS sugar transporter subunit IIA [Gemmatimonadales bacterium]
MPTLRDFLAESDILLDLQGASKDHALVELIARLGVGADNGGLLLRILQRRESLGSTGIGRGVAIPHCRTQLVSRLRVVFGRQAGGIPWDAVDGQPVKYIFLLAAPPIEVSNDYLPVLGRIAELVKEPSVPERLSQVQTPAEFLALLEERRV